MGSTGCVTVTVCVIDPSLLLIVTVPTRCADPVLGVTLTLNEPSLVRFAGVTFEIVSQAGALLVGMFHVVLDVTLTVIVPPSPPGIHEFADMVRRRIVTQSEVRESVDTGEPVPLTTTRTNLSVSVGTYVRFVAP